jgi:hypothetical protein
MAGGWTEHDEQFHSGNSPQEIAAAKRLGAVLAGEITAGIESASTKIAAMSLANSSNAIASFAGHNIGAKLPPGYEAAQARLAAQENQEKDRSAVSFNGLRYSLQSASMQSYFTSASIAGLVSSIEGFAQPIETVFGYFRTGLEQIGGLAKKQFGDFVAYETDILTAANDLRNSLTVSKYDKTPVLSMDQAIALNEKIRPKMIEMANSLPGENKDYLMVSRSLIDSAAIAARGDVSRVQPIIEAITKTSVLATTTAGKSPVVGITGMNQFMATGRLNSQSALTKAAPALAQFLNDPKMGTTGTYEERVDKIIKAGEKLYPKEVTDRYEGTFATRAAFIKEQLIGETGIFSFVREISGTSIGDRIKAAFVQLVPDFSPMIKLVDSGVLALQAFIDPLVARASKMIKGSGERIAALDLKDLLKPSALFGAITGLSGDQQVKLINEVFSWLNQLVKDIGNAMRGGSADPVVKALVEGITNLFREINLQKLQLTIQNAPALAAADPLGTINLLAGTVGFLAQLGVALTFLPAIISSVVAGFSFLVPIIVGIGSVIAALAFGAASAVAAFFSLPVIAGAAIVAAVVGLFTLIALNWESVIGLIKSSWATVIKFLTDALNMINPVNVLAKAGSYLSGGSSPTALPPSTSPTAAPTAAPKSVKLSLEVNDERGTLNALTKDNLLAALGESLSAQYGSLFEPSFT